MAEVTLLSRCPTCGQTRVQAALCRCGHYEWSHKIDPHRGDRTVCYRGGPAGACDCRGYVEAVDR